MVQFVKKVKPIFQIQFFWGMKWPNVCYICHTFNTFPLSPVKSCEFVSIFSPELPFTTSTAIQSASNFLQLLLITWQANGELGRQIFSIIKSISFFGITFLFYHKPGIKSRIKNGSEMLTKNENVRMAGIFNLVSSAWWT